MIRRVVVSVGPPQIIGNLFAERIVAAGDDRSVSVVSATNPADGSGSRTRKPDDARCRGFPPPAQKLRGTLT
jgi:hypothetical protein